MHYDMRKYFFFIKTVTPMWSSLPVQVVSVESVNSFKNVLDKVWHNQPVNFDCKVTLLGTGNWSQK